jgi:hypothetical protein
MTLIGTYTGPLLIFYTVRIRYIETRSEISTSDLSIATISSSLYSSFKGRRAFTPILQWYGCRGRLDLNICARSTRGAQKRRLEPIGDSLLRRGVMLYSAETLASAQEQPPQPLPATFTPIPKPLRSSLSPSPTSQQRQDPLLVPAAKAGLAVSATFSAAPPP